MRAPCGGNWGARVGPMNCACCRGRQPIRRTGRWWPWARRNTWAMPYSGLPWQWRWPVCLSISVSVMPRSSPMQPVSHAKTPGRRGRLQLLLLLAATIGPILLATAMYKWQFWVPESRNYHGELIGNGQSRSELGVAAAETRWQLLVTAPVRCQRDCQQLLYLARQIQIGLGREAARASHALASAEPLAPSLQSQLQTEY